MGMGDKCPLHLPPWVDVKIPRPAIEPFRTNCQRFFQTCSRGSE